MKRFLSLGVGIALSLFPFHAAIAVSVSHITLEPGWNTFATPQLLSDLSFSNGGEGLSFYQLEGGTWSNQTVVPTITNIRPLEGFMVYNGNAESVQMSLTCREADADDLLHQKSLSIGWNIVGLADSAFTVDPLTYTTVEGDQVLGYLGGEGFASIVDFTTTHSSNAAVGISTIAPDTAENSSFQEFKAYGIFINKEGKVHGGTQSEVGNESVHVYAEEDEQNAFVLTEKFLDIEYDEYDFGNLVTSINGLAGDSSHYWALYVNGEFSQVGASDLALKKGDKISWIYSSF